MVSMYQKSMMTCPSGYYTSPIFVPCSFYFLQPMCVDPWSQEVLLLLVYRILWRHFFLGYYSTHGWCFLYPCRPNKYSFWQYGDIGIVIFPHIIVWSS